VFIQWKRGRDFWAGVLLGLGLFKFQFVAPFALVFMLRRKWRFVQGFLLTAAGLGVLSLIAVGWQGIWSYVRLLTHVSAGMENQFYGSYRDMPTVAAFVHALLGDILGGGRITAIAAAASAGLILWVAWCLKSAGAEGAAGDLMFAATIVVSLVTGAHMFMHDLSPLLLAMWLAVAHFPARERRALRTILGAALVLFWMPPLYIALVACHRGYLGLPVLIIFLGGVVAAANDRSNLRGRLAGD